jgi:hypothetical protein
MCALALGIAIGAPPQRVDLTLRAAQGRPAVAAIMLAVAPWQIVSAIA